MENLQKILKILPSPILSEDNIFQKQWQFKHYHNTAKGCEIEPRKLRYKRGTRIFSINGGFCKTHQKEICRCGWEFSHHFDYK